MSLVNCVKPRIGPSDLACIVINSVELVVDKKDYFHSVFVNNSMCRY